MTLVVLIVSALGAALLSMALTPLAIRLSHFVGAIDRPDARKVHAIPTPRLGGLAVVAASAIALAGSRLFVSGTARFFQPDKFWYAVALGVLPVLLVSILDDVRSLPALPRFLTQVVGAAIAVALGVRLGPDIHLFGNTLPLRWVAAPLSVFWIVGVTNAFNIVDGLDGLSAGLALISAISLVAVSIVSHRPEMAIAAAIIAGALFGFLPFNIYPAKVFLGDSGATAVGFTLACLALGGGSTLTAGMAIVVPILVMGLPIAETVVSMVRRVVRNVPHNGMFTADRDHFHHRLLLLGFNQRRAVLMLYGVGLLAATTAIVSVFLTVRGASILFVALLVAAAVGLQKLGYDEFAFIRKGTVLRAYDAPVLRSTLFVAFIDGMILLASLYAAFILKYDDWLILHHRTLGHQLFSLFPPVYVLAFALSGVYRASWRSASVEDLLKPSFAILCASTVLLVVAPLFAVDPPVTLVITFTLVLLLMINASRASYRLLLQWRRRATSEGDTVLIYGAGVGGALAVRELLSNAAVGVKPIGFIDDDPHLEGRVVNGFPVLGSIESVAELLVERRVKGVIVTTTKISGDRLLRVREICTAGGAWIRQFRIDFSSEPGDMAELDAPRVPIQGNASPRPVPALIVEP